MTLNSLLLPRYLHSFTEHNALPLIPTIPIMPSRAVPFHPPLNPTLRLQHLDREHVLKAIRLPRPRRSIYTLQIPFTVHASAQSEIVSCVMDARGAVGAGSVSRRGVGGVVAGFWFIVQGGEEGAECGGGHAADSDRGLDHGPYHHVRDCEDEFNG